MPAMINRRELMAGLGSAAVAWPMTEHAQQSMPVIGHLTATPELAQRTLAGFRKGLAELGFVEGQNFRFEFRYHNFQPGGTARLMAELADQKLTLILVSYTLALERAKAATQSIPIVFTIGSEDRKS